MDHSNLLRQGFPRAAPLHRAHKGQFPAPCANSPLPRCSATSEKHVNELSLSLPHKLLSMYGIRVNVRENERKRRTREQIDAGVKLTGVAVPFDGRGGDRLGLAQTSAAGGSTTPTQIMLYPPTSTTSGPSSVAATEQHDRARPHGLSDSRGFSSAMYDGMEVDEWDDY